MSKLRAALLTIALVLPAVSYANDDEIVVTANISVSGVRTFVLDMYSRDGGGSGGGGGVTVPLNDPEQDPRTREEMEKEIQDNAEIVVTAQPPMQLGDNYVAYYYHGVYAIYRDGSLNWLWGDKFKGYFVPWNGSDGTPDLVIRDPDVATSVEYKGVKGEVEYKMNTTESWRRTYDPGPRELPMPEGDEPPR